MFRFDEDKKYSKLSMKQVKTKKELAGIIESSDESNVILVASLLDMTKEDKLVCSNVHIARQYHNSCLYAPVIDNIAKNNLLGNSVQIYYEMLTPEIQMLNYHDCRKVCPFVTFYNKEWFPDVYIPYCYGDDRFSLQSAVRELETRISCSKKLAISDKQWRSL